MEFLAHQKKHSLKWLTGLSVVVLFVILFLCVLISLIIETAQAWMPSRSSSQLDLMCNTAGSVIGIMIALWMLRKRAVD